MHSVASLVAKLNGSRKVQDALRKLGGETEKQLKDVTKLALQNIRSTAARTVAVDEGRLKSSIETTLVRGGLGGSVETRVDYASDVEFGTKPHKIVAKNGKALRFVAQAGSRLTDRRALFVSSKTGRLITAQKNARAVYVKSVNHPGTKAQPFMRPAFKQWKPWYLKNIPKGVRVAVGKVTVIR